MRDKVFYTICFGFMFGVLIRSFLFVNIFWVLCVSLIGFSLLLFFGFISNNKRGIIVSLFVITFSFGIMRLDSADTGLVHRLSEVDYKRILIGMMGKAVFGEVLKGDIGGVK